MEAFNETIVWLGGALLFWGGGWFAALTLRGPRAARRFSCGCCGAGAVLGGLAAAAALAAAAPPRQWLWRWAAGKFLSLQADPLTAFFLLGLSLTVLVAAAGLAGGPARRPDAVRLSALALTAALTLAAGDAPTFLLAWNGFNLAVLLTRPVGRAAGRRFLLAHSGALALALAFAGLFYHTGSLDFAAYAAFGAAIPAAARDWIFGAALLGFGLQALRPERGLPLPAAVAAYGIIRFGFDFLGGAFAGWGLALGAAGGAVAALAALAARRAAPRRGWRDFAAYGELANTGVIFAALGAACFFASRADGATSVLALTAALYHAFGLPLYRMLLHLAGPARKPPFLLGAMALAGLPPLGGLIGAWASLEAALRLLFDAATLPAKLCGAAGALSLALAGAALAGAAARQCAFERGRPAAVRTPRLRRAALYAAGAAALGLGLAPGFLLNLTVPAAGPYGGVAVGGNLFLLQIPFFGRPWQTLDVISPLALALAAAAALGLVLKMAGRGRAAAGAARPVARRKRPPAGRAGIPARWERTAARLLSRVKASFIRRRLRLAWRRAERADDVRIWTAWLAAVLSVMFWWTRW